MTNVKKFAMSLLCMSCSQAYAADYVSETDYYQELPVVLSASRLSQPLSEAPNAMTVIDRKMIVASGFRSIPDLFKMVPGMYVSAYKGSQPFVAYHGSIDQYAHSMQVMIDGRSVYMPPMNMVDWAQLPVTVDDIERIEVIRGPAAASHGANSTQGVISITTREAGSAEGRQVSYTHGSQGINDVAARFGHRGDTLDYHMTVAYTADNGYDNLTSPPNNYPITKFQAPSLINNTFDSSQARLINYRADYHPNGIDRFDVQFGMNHNVKSVGWTDSTGNPVHDLFANSGFMQLGWIRALDNNAEFSLRYYHIGQNQHEAFPVISLGAGLITQSINAIRDEIELQHTLPLTPTNRLVYGAAYRTDAVVSQGNIPQRAMLYASDVSTNEFRLFAHDEWRIFPSLLLNTGAMLEKDGVGHQNVSPRASLNYHLTPQHTLRMGASIAYRTPSLMEQKIPVIQPGELFVINARTTSPGLLPEQMLSREIGYLGELPDWNTTIDLRVFNDQASNGIFYDNIIKKAFVNGLNLNYRGFEATVKHAFSEDSQLTANFSHELASSNVPALVSSGLIKPTLLIPSGTDLLSASMPRNSASLLFSQRLSHEYAFSTSFYYQAAMQPFDRGVIDFQPIQRRVDARIAKAFNQGGGVKGEIALVMQNMFDSKYTEYVANNVFNRRGYVTLTLNW